VDSDPVASLASTEAVEDEVLESFSRFLGETGSLRDLIAEAAICGHCKKGKLNVTFDTKCLATSIHTRCENCHAHSASSTRSTRIPQESQDRNTSYAANVEFFLAQLLSGNGGTKSSHIVGMLDLLNQSIGTTAFPLLEYEIGKYIISYAEELMEKNLVREVEMHALNKPNFDLSKWKNIRSSEPDLIDVGELPLLTVFVTGKKTIKLRRADFVSANTLNHLIVNVLLTDLGDRISNKHTLWRSYVHSQVHLLSATSSNLRTAEAAACLRSASCCFHILLVSGCLIQ
jgi:hypothetical protein